MRIAVIGLGDIAQKAYLPIITTTSDIELVLCTRNQETLSRLARMYRISEAVNNIEELADKSLDAAFVHTSLESHTEVIEKILKLGIHIYLDKPIAGSYEESRRLVEMAEASGIIFMIGFNRRFAPMYNLLKNKEDRRLILMQKNRAFIPDMPRHLIFNDFIHVIDTLLYLAPGKFRDLRVSSVQEGGLIQQVIIQFDGDGFTAIGITNRHNGIHEEVLEVTCPGNKWVVRELDSTVHYSNSEEHAYLFNDWDTTVYRRGFPQIIAHFLDCVKHRRAPQQSLRDALETHAVCERITVELERVGSADGDRPSSG